MPRLCYWAFLAPGCDEWEDIFRRYFLLKIWYHNRQENINFKFGKNGLRPEPIEEINDRAAAMVKDVRAIDGISVLVGACASHQ